MKKLKLLISMLCVCVLCSCQLSLLSFSSQLNDKIEHSLSFLTGTKKYTVTLEDNEAFYIINKLQSGSLSIKITNDADEAIFESDSKAKDIQAEAPAGSYKVVVKAQAASGSYIITWK